MTTISYKGDVPNTSSSKSVSATIDSKEATVVEDIADGSSSLYLGSLWAWQEATASNSVDWAVFPTASRHAAGQNLDLEFSQRDWWRSL